MDGVRGINLSKSMASMDAICGTPLRTPTR